MKHLQDALDRIVNSPKGVDLNRRVEGMALASVQAIKKIQANGNAVALVTLDDGCACYRSHAVIRAAPGLGRSALRGPRNDLVKLLNANIVRGPTISWPAQGLHK